MKQGAPDEKKFRSSLGLIFYCRRTGVGESQIFSMALVKHMGKRVGVLFEAKEFPHED